MTSTIVITFHDSDGAFIDSQSCPFNAWGRAREIAWDTLDDMNVGSSAKISDGKEWELWKKETVTLTRHREPGVVDYTYQDDVVHCVETGLHSMVVRHG